jgi:hypothetical protein
VRDPQRAPRAAAWIALSMTKLPSGHSRRPWGLALTEDLACRRAHKSRGSARTKPARYPNGYRAGFVVFGGGEGIRTPGLSDANAALSQLSYTPTGCRNDVAADYAIIPWKAGSRDVESYQTALWGVKLPNALPLKGGAYLAGLALHVEARREPNIGPTQTTCG